MVYPDRLRIIATSGFYADHHVKYIAQLELIEIKLIYWNIPTE